MNTTRLQELFSRYYQKTATATEREELMRLIQKHSSEEVAELIKQSGESLTAQDEILMPDRAELVLQNILHTHNKIRVIYWKRWVIAASVLLTVGIGTYYLFLANRKTENQVARTNQAADIKAPAEIKARITLGNGQTIYLDSLDKGALTLGEMKLMKIEDGEIAYSGSTTEVIYNTLINPRGSKVVSLTLNDGSRVWLNAESSLRYPIAFNGNERKVEITGEAYFEVIHNATIPFKVNVAGKCEVEVLGTHFNINAYADEITIKTSLLEGSIRMSNLLSHQSQVLVPGQQALLHADGRLSVNSEADMDEVMAWKNGLFNFNGQDIESILKQVGRWYDVDIRFQSEPNKETFSGIVKRSENLSKVLKVMERAGVKFNIEGRTIVVNP